MNDDSPRGDQIEPLAVRLVGPVPQPLIDVFSDVYQTVILIPASAGNPSWEEILPASPARVRAWVLAIDDDMLISDNASDAANGRGATIPKTLTAWTPIEGAGALFAAPAGAMVGPQSRVSVISVYRSKG